MLINPRFANKPIHLQIPNVTTNAWGGSWIPRIKRLKPSISDPVGESWEFSTHPLHPNHIEVAPGQTEEANELVKKFPNELIGAAVAKWGARSPLLIKFIDAAENLSVQVHPSDDYAHQNENDSGKTESWIILNPGPLYIGFNAVHADRFGNAKFQSAFQSAVEDANALGATEDLSVRKKAEKFILPFMNKIDARRGDIFHVPPGAIHAIGAGVRLLEIQQSSGVTYRVWDWNRPDPEKRKRGQMGFRPLHTCQAMEVLDFRAQPPEHYRVSGTAASYPAAGYEFEMRGLKSGESVGLSPGAAFKVVTVVAGEIAWATRRGVARGRTKEGFSTWLSATCEEVVLTALKAAEIVVTAPTV